MKITIVGAGKIGGALAAGLSRAGHQIQIANRSNIPEMAQQGDVIIVSVPFTAVTQVGEQLKNTDGRAIIDTSNAFGKTLPGYANGVEALKVLSGNPDVAKCFNTIGSEDLANPKFCGIQADSFTAGDSTKAKVVALRLSLDMGFANCYDLGGDDALPLLENLTLTWWALANHAGLGRRSAFRILTDSIIPSSNS